MPANIELSGVETFLIGIMSSETVLKEYIAMVSDRYDYVIVDCSPNIGPREISPWGIFVKSVNWI